MAIFVRLALHIFTLYSLLFTLYSLPFTLSPKSLAPSRNSCYINSLRGVA